MHFLGFNLLWALLPFVAIPVLIHWLSRRFPKKFPFSSIEEIRRTLSGRSRIFRWRHLLMLLLRTLALAALLLAFLRPVLTSRKDNSQHGRNILIFVDHSLSMGYLENGTTAAARARAEVKRLLDSLSADDSFNIIRVDQSPAAAFTSFSTNAKGALAFLDDSPPPLTSADFRAANLLASELAKGLKSPPDVYYFSDFQRRSWADVNFSILPAGARLYFVATTEDPARPNRSIVSLGLGQGAVITGGEAEAKIRIANHSPRPWSGKVEAGFGPANLRELPVSLAPWSEGEFSLGVPIPESGLLGLTASLPADSLPADNSRHLAVRVNEREEVILLTGDETDPNIPAPSLFLATAVNPYGDDKGTYRPKHLAPDTLTPATVAASSRLIASRLPLLDDSAAATLITFLKGGGGAILFLDGDNDAINLAKIGSLAGESLPLRLTEKLNSGNLPDGSMKVASGDFNSRFLRLFEGTRRQNLAQLEFYNLYHAAPTGTGKTLLTYADGTPAMTESTIGLGTLLICNFSVAEASSNLARQRLFPAWIHEMLLRMSISGSAAEDPYLVGDSVAGDTWAAEASGRDLLSPDGKTARIRSETTGERMNVSFRAAAPGIYRMPGGDGRNLLAFAINTDPSQSDLRTLDPAVLPDRATGSEKEASFVGKTTDYAALLHGKPAFHWFLLAALGFLLIEGVLFKSAPRTTS
jgi:Aerotolerance regulator N-terminal